MNELQALTENLKVMGEGFEGFKAKYDSRIDEIETMLGRGAFGGASSLGGNVNFSPVAKEHKEKFLAWVRSGADRKGCETLKYRLPSLPWTIPKAAS